MAEENTTIESERRIATVMFADISGFTAMSEKMDPEQVTCTMNECFCMMEECIEHHGGTIDKFIGDCVMVLFGIPKAVEDAPQKAINTAIELRNRLYQFNKEKNLSIPLNIHIGINTGPVVSGMVGGSKRQDFTVMGDTVNLASRIEGASKVGQILVGPATYKATKNGFQYKTLPPIVLKGKAEPVAVFELLSEKEMLHRLQIGADRIISSVMVGRDVELNTLENILSKAVNGEGSIVSVVGEAGIGKSRLIAELKNQEVMKRVTLLEGRAISMGANLGYHLIIDLLKNWAQITDDDSEVSAFTKLESAIHTTYPEALSEIMPFVATLMGIKLVGRYAERVKGIEGEALEKLILKNVRDLVTKGTNRLPLVVILEDLHWADTSSIELIESLSRLAAKERIVFINVFRPGYTYTGDRVIKTIQKNHPDKYTEIVLQPLDEKQTEALITNLLNIKGFPHKLKDKIIQRAGGNPYFIEEVVRSFIDEGAVFMNDSGFEVTDKLSTMSVPRTINEVLMARIDRLDQKTRDLVKTASVIGRNFFYRILVEVAQTVDDMDSRLEYLKEIQLIRERSRMEELEYLFKHALAQEVAYDSILIQRRKELHKNVADSIEKIFHERLHEFYGMLAFHYSQAEDLEKAEEYLIKAGEESLKSSASAEALHYYQQALEFYLIKYGDKADPGKVAVMEKNIALALFNSGRLSESVGHFERFLAFHNERVPKNTVLKFLKFSAGFISFLSALYLPSLIRKPFMSDKEWEIIDIFYKKVEALGVTNVQEFFIQTFYLFKCINKYDQASVPNKISASLSILFSWPAISFALSRKTLEYAKVNLDSGDVEATMGYQLSKMILEGMCGRWPQEIDFNSQLIEKNLAIGELLFTGFYIEWVSFFKLARGDFEAVRWGIQRLTDIGDSYDADQARTTKYIVSTLYFVKLRKLYEAIKEADAGIPVAAGFGIVIITLCALKARAQTMLGDDDGAEGSLKHAERISLEVKAAPQNLGELALARYCLEMQRLEKAKIKGDRDLFSKQQPATLKSGEKAVKFSLKYAFFLTDAFRLMGIYFWLIGKQRNALKWWRKAIAEGTRLSDRLELSRTYFEVGKRLLERTSKYKELDGIKAEEYLEKARMMFDEMDLQWDLDELEKLKIHVGIPV